MFDINHSTKIYIYGYGLVGSGSCERLLSCGYNLIGILDQKGSSLKAPVPSYCLGEEPYWNDACIIVCLGITMEHTTVVRQLLNRGYTKLLFLPLYSKSKAAKVLIESYYRFIEGNFTELKNIPLYDEIWRIQIEDYILHEIGDFVVVMIPSSQVYTAKLNGKKLPPLNPYKIYMEDYPASPDWFYDQPIGSEPINDHMMERVKKNEKYLKFLENTLSHGLNFFTDSPSPAQFNLNGYFNLMDGHNRTAFLCHKGFQYVPLRVLKDDYVQYFKQEAAEALMDYCKDLDELPLPVKHPAFSRFPVTEQTPDKKFTQLRNTLVWNTE